MIVKTKSILVLLTVAACATISATADLVDYPLGASIRIGDGFDPIGNKGKSSPFLPPAVEKAQGVGGSESEFKLVESASDLNQVMKINSDNNFGLVFKASIAGSFLKEVELHEYAFNFIIRSRCLLVTSTIKGEPVLNPDAENLLKTGKLAQFRSIYGDYYVKSVTPGGDFLGLIQIQTSSAKEREEIRAKGNFKGVNWESRNDFSKDVSKFSKSISTNVQKKIYGVLTAEPKSMGEMFSFAAAFPTNIAASGGSPVRIEIVPYDGLAAYDKAIHEIPTPIRQAVQRLSDLYLDYRMLRDTLNFALSSSNAKRFDYDRVTKSELDKAKVQVVKTLNLIEANSEKVLRGELLPSSSDAEIMPINVFSQQLHMPEELIVLSGESMEIFPLMFVSGGNHDMSGNRPRISIDSLITQSTDGKELTVSTKVLMVEAKSDWTTFGGSESRQLLDMRGTGMHIIQFNPKSGTLRAQAGNDDHSWHLYNGSRLIQSAHCISDVKGDEDGKIGAKPVSFAPIKITVARDGR